MATGFPSATVYVDGKIRRPVYFNSMYYTGYPTSPQPTPAMDIAIDLRV